MKLIEILRQHGEYNIVGHMRPDGDCVGSQLAICNILRKMGIACNLIKNDVGDRAIEEYFTGQPTISPENCDPSLPLICVDCSDMRRIGDILLQKYGQPYLNIDHHFSNEHFATHNFVDPNVASTTQLIAKILLEEKIDFDKQTAEFLYLGIMTDTGNFSYSNTTLETFQIVEALMTKGISIFKNYRNIYERNSIEKYRLLCRMLNNLEVFADGLCCISFLTEKDFQETGANPIETKEFVNYTRKIDGVEVGAFVEFHPDYTKCSLRSSTSDFRVDLLAQKFNGGGHQAAAGFKIGPTDKNFYQNLKIALAEHTKKFYKHSHAV